MPSQGLRLFRRVQDAFYALQLLFLGREDAIIALQNVLLATIGDNNTNRLSARVAKLLTEWRNIAQFSSCSARTREDNVILRRVNGPADARILGIGVRPAAAPSLSYTPGGCLSIARRRRRTWSAWDSVLPSLINPAFTVWLRTVGTGSPLTRVRTLAWMPSTFTTTM